VSEYFKRRATSLGIKTQELIKSPEEMQQEAQQAQQAAMMQAAIPNGVNAISSQISNAQEGANMNQQISE
jgi:primosomal replication protein N